MEAIKFIWAIKEPDNMSYRIRDRNCDNTLKSEYCQWGEVSSTCLELLDFGTKSQRKLGLNVF